MRLIPQGDYYVWFCDWCDSRNLTLWTRVEKGKVVCGACFTPFANLPFSGEAGEMIRTVRGFGYKMEVE